MPAILVWAVPDLIARYVLRVESKLSPGFVANLGSYALAALVGAEHAGARVARPQGAAVAPVAVRGRASPCGRSTSAFARLAFAPFYQGYRPVALIRDEFFDLAPAVLGMLVVGVAAAVGVEAFGVWALAALALVIVVPQVALERIAAGQSAGRLARADAMRLYTAAIADVLDVPREQRRELACAAELVARRRGPDHQPRPRLARGRCLPGRLPRPARRASAGRATAGRPASPPRRSRGAAGSSRSPTPGPR